MMAFVIEILICFAILLTVLDLIYTNHTFLSPIPLYIPPLIVLLHFCSFFFVTLNVKWFRVGFLLWNVAIAEHLVMWDILANEHKTSDYLASKELFYQMVLNAKTNVSRNGVKNLDELEIQCIDVKCHLHLVLEQH